MKEEFVTYEIAVKLKEKGFDCNEPFAMYNELGVFHKLYSSADFTVSYGVNLRDCYDYDDFDDHDTVAPTISQVLLWLREEKRLHVEFISAAYGYTFIISKVPSCGGSDIYHARNHGPNDGGAWDDYEDCAKASVEYILDNLI